MTADTSSASKTSPQSPARLAMALSVVWRALLFTGAWVVLAGTEAGSAIIGIPAVVVATWASWRLAQHSGPRMSPWGVLRFLPFFAVESVRGGLDVASRVLGPRVRVEPGYHDYCLSLRTPAARVLFVDLVSLLPGTLSADLRGRTVTIHALDRGADIDGELARLERRVAALFSEQADARGPTSARPMRVGTTFRDPEPPEDPVRA